MHEILILDDDFDFCEMVAASLEALGEVKSFQDPKEFLSYSDNKDNIKLMLIDFNLQHKNMTGFDVIKEVKQRKNAHLIPILMVSGADDIHQEAYSSGIDDYIQKPIIPSIFAKKVEHTLFNTNQKIHMNPLTGLPGNFIIEQEYSRKQQSNKDYSVAYIDMDHFKGFNDEKGVKAGDDAIQLLANVLSEHRTTYSKEELFVGHLGGDDFFLIGDIPIILDVIKVCYIDFVNKSAHFFKEEENKQKFYFGKNRDGEKLKIPLLSLSTAIIHIYKEDVGSAFSFSNFSEKVSSVKKRAKSKHGNSVVVEKMCNLIE